MGSDVENEFRVLVIGGGNCGLAVATGLKKAGIACTVFERDSEHDFVHNTRDWGMLLHWGGEYLEKLLPSHLQARMKEPRVDPSHEMTDPIPYLNGETGEIFMHVPTEVITRVSRKKLRKFLTEGENLHIRFNKRLRSMAVSSESDTVTAHFEDGTIETGNMVIGCDGSHSKVREFLVGAEAAQLEDTGHTMINYAATGYTPEQAHLLRSYHPIVKLCIHPTTPGGALLAALDIPSPTSNPRTWRFQTYTSWSGPPSAADLADPQARMAFVRKRMSTFCEPFRTAFLVPADAGAAMPVYAGRQWAPPVEQGWDNRQGRVTLAGDAAHSMLPHRGQGLNNAMKDVSDLVDAIVQARRWSDDGGRSHHREESSSSSQTGGAALAEAVTAYEAEMRPRGAEEVALSLEQARKSAARDVLNSPMAKMGHGRR